MGSNVVRFKLEDGRILEGRGYCDALANLGEWMVPDADSDAVMDALAERIRIMFGENITTRSCRKFLREMERMGLLHRLA